MALMPRAGAEFAGYRLVWVVSKGDMSTLFLAEDPYLGAVIALKVLDGPLADGEASRARFLEESGIAASLNHPNVIPIHDIGSSDDLLYIAMRCVTGTDLRQLPQENERLAADRAVLLIGQAARALDTAHRHGLVHRGIKPANLLVEPGADGSGSGHLYVTDFGITPPQADLTGMSGPLDYLAPEQVRGLPAGGAADQYSLGCVLYECLTGTRPAGTAFVPPTAYRRDLPAAIDEVFARVLAASPGDRFDNCRDFVAAARRALGPVADPRLAGGSPLLRPVSYPVPPYGPVLASPPLPAPGPAGHPAEVAHEAAGAPEADGLVPGPSDSPPALPPGLPDPVPWLLPRRERRGGWRPEAGRWTRPGRERGRGWLLPLAALVLIAGTTAGVTLSLAGGNGSATAAGSGGAAAGRAATSANPTVTTSPSTGASHLVNGSPPMSASSSVSPGSSLGAGPSVSAAPGMSTAVSVNNCTKEQPGNGANGPATLAGVLADANSCSVPRYLIPAAKCAAGTSTTPGEQVMTCSAPAPQIVQVTFRTYPTLAALYGAYASSVSSLDGTGTLTQNTGASCGATGASYAEAGWNHQEVHPRQYTVAEMAAGRVPQLSAMGRLACFSQGNWQYLVWTTDVGRMLAVATGTGSPSGVYNWWASLHHVIIFPGTEMCGMPDRMDSVPLGNLVQEPVCPAGAGMTAGLPDPDTADHDGHGTGEHGGILERIVIIGHDVALRVDAKEVTRG
jgi:serine/threonine protein kinase